jgi:hypothetical protein
MLTDSGGIDFRFNPSAGLDQAKSWLQACLDDHDCPSSAPGLLPSRVIDVSNSDPNLLRLETPPSGTHERYAALSYCWGSGYDGSYLTSAANLQERREGFSVDLLPRSIREAVRVTQRLGLRYLWVDAICILQGTDDVARKDWLAESSRCYDLGSRGIWNGVNSQFQGQTNS